MHMQEQGQRGTLFFWLGRIQLLGLLNDACRLPKPQLVHSQAPGACVHTARSSRAPAARWPCCGAGTWAPGRILAASSTGTAPVAPCQA